MMEETVGEGVWVRCWVTVDRRQRVQESVPR